MQKRYLLLLFLGFILALGACKKGEDDFINPFDDPSLQPPEAEEVVVNLDPNSIDGLHHFVFKPTCSNSGCHDGTFLPDFRTIESSYNTMLWKTPINGDTTGVYKYRVEPGNANNSMLIRRLTEDVPNLSGMMPLQWDPESDWPTKKDEYINNVRNWINAGAPDMFGNIPVEGDLQPQLSGIVAFPAGNTTQAYDRKPGKGSIKIPQGTGPIDIWFSLSDAESDPSDFDYNKIKFGDHLNDFDEYIEEPLTIPAVPITEEDYFGDQSTFTHKATFDPSQFGEGKIIFIRIYVRDDGVLVTELPNNGGATYIKLYSSIEIIP